MGAPDPPPLTVVRPGEGRRGDLGAITVDFKLFGADTGGSMAIVEHGFPPGAWCRLTCIPARTSTPSSPRD